MYEWTNPDTGDVYQIDCIVTQSESEGPEYLKWRLHPDSVMTAADAEWKRLPPFASAAVLKEIERHFYGPMIEAQKTGVNVRVCGPNLNDQSKGTFHVHADGCRDLRNYGPGGSQGGDMDGMNEMLIVNATVRKIVFETYADQIAERINFEQQTEEEAVDDLAGDFHFFPCCASLLRDEESVA